MKRRLSWGVVGVLDEVPDMFMMIIMKRRGEDFGVPQITFLDALALYLSGGQYECTK